MGLGETSFVNLARRELERIGIPILDFNPWMFSGAEQLIEAFFAELAAQLRVKPELADVAKAIDEYSETLAGLTWLPDYRFMDRPGQKDFPGALKDSRPVEKGNWPPAG